MTANPTQDASDYLEMRLAEVRRVMRHDDAWKWIVPGDLRLLVGEIDRLRDRLSAAPPPPVNASAIDVGKAAEEIVDRITEPATHKHAVELVAAIILRHSAAPGLRLTEEEREFVKNLQFDVHIYHTNLDQRVANRAEDHVARLINVVKLLAIIDRLAPTGPTQTIQNVSPAFSLPTFQTEGVLT